MLETLDAPAVRLWSAAAADALAACQDEINELNVFPVPDGDTGTNLSLTLRAAADAVAESPAQGASAVLRTMARGAVLGARGNSGVIVSQILRGLADTIDADCCDADSFTDGLRAAVTQAYDAVADPVEGTVLSVIRAAADAAKEVRGEGGELSSVVTAALAGAAEALCQTPEQLPALARAGVVDAGGRGLVVILEALAAVVTGVATVAPPRGRTPRGRSALEAVRESGSDQFDYEVQFLLAATDADVASLRTELAQLGDCVVVVGTGDGLWNVHVHVNDVGATLDAALDAGRPRRISVVRFADQIAESRRPLTAQVAEIATEVVAVAPGAGLGHVFAGEGVHVVDGGPGANPSTAEVLLAIRSTGATQVVLLPNASQVSGVARSAATEARTVGIDVAVVPTRSPVQGLAAIAVHDPHRPFGEDVIAMTEAAAATRWAEIAVAEREALTSVGPCQPGDVLGLIAGEVVEIGTSVELVARSVLDRLLGAGGELVTLVAGADANLAIIDSLRAHIDAQVPLADVSVFDGGQPHSPLLIGVE